MANITTLRVYADAISLVKAVHAIEAGKGFGDLISQLRRAAISVGSNISEGAGFGSDAGFARHLRIARGSVNEVEAQLAMLEAIGRVSSDGEAMQLSRAIGRQLTRLIQFLDRGGG